MPLPENHTVAAVQTSEERTGTALGLTTPSRKSLCMFSACTSADRGRRGALVLVVMRHRLSDGHSQWGPTTGRSGALKVTAHSVERWLRLPFPWRSAPAGAGGSRSRTSRPGRTSSRAYHPPAGQACVALRSAGSLGCFSWFLRRWKATAQPPARRRLTPTRPSGSRSRGCPSGEGSGPTRLHAMLLRTHAARCGDAATIYRFGARLDDVAHQAAADAMMAIIAKVGQFRGESRFTTWAYKFVIFEVSTKIGRHFWRNRTVPMDAETGASSPTGSVWIRPMKLSGGTVVNALVQAVDEDLTDRQRQFLSPSSSMRSRLMRSLPS